MPDVSDYDDQTSWMRDCVSEMMDEGREQDQAVAACLNMWRNRAAENWTCGASRNLPIAETERAWDGAAAARRMLDRANIGAGDGTPNAAMARQGFLIYDTGNSELRGLYSSPFADIVDGQLKAISSGLRAAASRLPQVTGVPQEVRGPRARRARRLFRSVGREGPQARDPSPVHGPLPREYDRRRHGRRSSNRRVLAHLARRQHRTANRREPEHVQ
jgi:hypothetical protein